MRRFVVAGLRILGALVVLGLIALVVSAIFFGPALYKLPVTAQVQPAVQQPAADDATAAEKAAADKAAADKAAADKAAADKAAADKAAADQAAQQAAADKKAAEDNAAALAAQEAANKKAADDAAAALEAQKAANAEVIDQTFTYTPGGKNYAWPKEGSVEEIPADKLNGDAGWTRIRQAANGQFLAWTSLVRVTANSPIDDYLQWDSATKLLVTNPGTADITVKIEIRRDTLAAAECKCNPYEQANAKKSPLGLEWDITGTLASVTVGDADPVALTGLGVKTMPFPENFNGIWTIVLTLKPGSQVTINQGETMTSTPTWPLTNATAITTTK